MCSKMSFKLKLKAISFSVDLKQRIKLNWGGIDWFPCKHNSINPVLSKNVFVRRN